eukprot:538206-Rhodomonas_salina.1
MNLLCFVNQCVHFVATAACSSLSSSLDQLLESPKYSCAAVIAIRHDGRFFVLSRISVPTRAMKHTTVKDFKFKGHAAVAKKCSCRKEVHASPSFYKKGNNPQDVVCIVPDTVEHEKD